MRSLVLMAVCSAAVLAGCGDDSGEGEDVVGEGCPTFAAATEGQGEAYKDFIVGFELALMRDPDARADLLAGVSDELCLAVTEEKQLALDSVVVDSGRPLGPDGQRALLDALTAAEGVTYAEPDRTVAVEPVE